MSLKDIFGKFQSSDELQYEDEYIELGVPSSATSADKVLIKVDKLSDYTDSDRVQQKVREGNIMLVKIKDLKDKDMGELKRAINRIRKTVIAVDGDIAGVSDEWIVVTPNFAKVHRAEQGKAMPEGTKEMAEEGEQQEKEVEAQEKPSPKKSVPQEKETV